MIRSSTLQFVLFLCVLTPPAAVLSQEERVPEGAKEGAQNDAPAPDTESPTVEPGSDATTTPGETTGAAGDESTINSQSSTVEREDAKRGTMYLDFLVGSETLTQNLRDQLRIEPSSEGDTTRLQIGSRSWALDDLVSLRVPNPPFPVQINKAWILLLRSGETLRGTITGSDDDSVRFLAAEFERAAFEISLDAIQALITERSFQGRLGRLNYAPGAKARLIRRLRRMEVTSDVVFLRQQESTARKAGRIEGIVESLANEGVKFSSERLGDVEVTYGRLKAIALAQLESPSENDAKQQGRSILVRLRDDSSLQGKLLRLSEGLLTLRHAILGNVEIQLDRVADIAFFGGRVRYLSDVEPTRVEEFPGPLFNKTKRYQFKRDSNVLYGPLRMDGATYRKGLGVHSYSLLEFALDSADSRFQATIGLDDSARPLSGAVDAADVASVVFRVKVDDKLQFEKALSWRDTPVPLDVQIHDGKRLTLEVDFGGEVPGSMNSTLDRANWAEARLVQENTQ